RLLRQREVGGVEDERPRLWTTHAAVERDELLEGAPFVELRVVEAADHDVRDVGEAVRAAQGLGRVRGEGCERVGALDPIVGEVPHAFSAERDGAVRGRAYEQPADVRVRTQRRKQFRMALLDLLAGQAPWLLHEVDEPEVPRPEDDDLAPGDVVLGALL